MSWPTTTTACSPELPVPASLPQLEHYRPTAWDEQKYSPFFSKIPAEIRNDIYAYTFRAGARELLSVDAHPLSFLLTCRKVHNEASIIAFREYTFPLSTGSSHMIFNSKRKADSGLWSLQLQAITSFSYDMRRNYGCKDLGYEISKNIENAILLFPNLKLFEVRALRGRKTFEDVHCSYAPRRQYDKHMNAIRKYVPHWFHSIIDGVTFGCAYIWQTGERWKVEWPQLEDHEYFEIVEGHDLHGNAHVAPFMSPDATARVTGVQKCPCRCGNAVWTSANIVQDNGRMIKINAVFHGPEDRVCTDAELEASILARLAPGRVILQEGHRPLELAPGFSRDGKANITSYTWGANQQYWDGLRARNGEWIMKCRLAWQFVTSAASEERLPGSRSRNEGDWAIMAEMSKANKATAAGHDGEADHGVDA